MAKVGMCENCQKTNMRKDLFHSFHQLSTQYLSASRCFRLSSPLLVEWN